MPSAVRLAVAVGAPADRSSGGHTDAQLLVHAIVPPTSRSRWYSVWPPLSTRNCPNRALEATPTSFALAALEVEVLAAAPAPAPADLLPVLLPHAASANRASAMTGSHREARTLM